MVKRKHTNEFKSKVALEAILGEETIAALAQKHGVHPGQVQNWKAQMLQALPSVASIFPLVPFLIDQPASSSWVLSLLIPRFFATLTGFYNACIHNANLSNFNNSSFCYKLIINFF